VSDWDIDGYLTGTQKAIGVPVGLSITVVRPRALQRHRNLASQNLVSRNYYVNLQRWLPIMEAYEQKRASYYATPAVSLVYALHVGYSILLANGGMEKRFEEHKHVSVEFRNALRKLGYEFVPLNEEFAAHTMSAVKFPPLKEGSSNASFLGDCKKAGAIFAGGLHVQIKDTYFRVGHMGLSVRTPQHIFKAVHAIQVATSIHSSVPSDESAESYIQTRL
jgi:alanine-glyoxylate transaminase/serine-glyoxylate transaminase/serine-pyruvate transaminase